MSKADVPSVPLATGPLWMRALERGSDWIAGAFAALAFVAVALMALHVSASVCLRWATGRDIPVTTEMATYYYMVALTFLPLAFVERRGAHLSAEFLHALLPRGLRRLVEALNRLAVLGYLVFLTWRTGVDAIERTRSGDVISTVWGNFPVWPARWIVPVGLGAAALWLAIHCVARLAGLSAPRVQPAPTAARAGEK